RSRVASQIEEEAVVAKGLAGTQRCIPKITGAGLAVWAIRSGNVSGSRQKVRIVRCKRQGCFSLRQGGKSYVDVAVRALVVIIEAATGVVNRLGLLDGICGACSGR